MTNERAGSIHYENLRCFDSTYEDQRRNHQNAEDHLDYGADSQDPDFGIMSRFALIPPRNPCLLIDIMRQFPRKLFHTSQLLPYI